MKLSNWMEWRDADDKQRNSHWDDGTLGKPCKRPHSTPEQPVHVFRRQWTRVIKPGDGRWKSRICLDGSKRAAPWLRDPVATYASCIGMPCMRLFFALCAVENKNITFSDTHNAFQNAPPPTIPCCIRVDDAIADWYKRPFSVTLDPNEDVIPLDKALQGHPEAGALWEKFIGGILENDLKLKNTVHERNIYTGELLGKNFLMCRQVDDYAHGSESPDAGKAFCERASAHVKTEYKGMGTEDAHGMSFHYNGVDVRQTAHYIKIDCETYLVGVFQTHGWEVPERNQGDTHTQVPMAPDKVDKLQKLDGPTEGSVDALTLQTRMKFSYRQVLGELLFAYVICRLDIGYAVVFLTRFSLAPHEEHYIAVKNVVCYLRRTKSYGLVYWRKQPLKGLPVVPLDMPPIDPNLPPFPELPLDELVGFVDAAHATDLKTRRSVTGYVLLFALAAVAYKVRLQATVATSSTEAEFISAVSCAKDAKYIRSILTELRPETERCNCTS